MHELQWAAASTATAVVTANSFTADIAKAKNPATVGDSFVKQRQQ